MRRAWSIWLAALVAGGVLVPLAAEAQADALAAATLGASYYPNPNARLQVNWIAHRVNGPAPEQGFDEARWVPILLAQLQLKF